MNIVQTVPYITLYWHELPSHRKSTFLRSIESGNPVACDRRGFEEYMHRDTSNATDRTLAVAAETEGRLRCGRGVQRSAFAYHYSVSGNRRPVCRGLLARLLGCWRVDCVVEGAPVYEHPAAVDVSHVEIASVIECCRVRHRREII